MSIARKLTLHIGTEKTGTSTLQDMFAANRRLLRDGGLLYPSTPGHANHVGAALFALNWREHADLVAMLGLGPGVDLDAYCRDFIANLRDEIGRSGCREVLISNEHLSSRLKWPQGVERLVTALRQVAEQIRVIVYLRPQYELAPSWYSTSVKSGNSKPFKPPLNDDYYYFNYNRLLANWERFVAPADIAVRFFSRAEFTGGNLVDDFFAALGSPKPLGLAIVEDRNKSLDFDLLEYLRLANERIPWIVDGAVSASRSRFMEALESLSSGRKPFADEAVLRRIENAFAASNDEVVRRYFPGRRRLFPAFESSGKVTQPVDLTLERAVEIGVDICKFGIDAYGPRPQ